MPSMCSRFHCNSSGSMFQDTQLLKQADTLPCARQTNYREVMCQSAWWLLYTLYAVHLFTKYVEFPEGVYFHFGSCLSHLKQLWYYSGSRLQFIFSTHSSISPIYRTSNTSDLLPIYSHRHDLLLFILTHSYASRSTVVYYYSSGTPSRKKSTETYQRPVSDPLCPVAPLSACHWSLELGTKNIANEVLMNNTEAQMSSLSQTLGAKITEASLQRPCYLMITTCSEVYQSVPRNTCVISLWRPTNKCEEGRNGRMDRQKHR